MRHLPCKHTFRRISESDHLLVREHEAIVGQHHRVPGQQAHVQAQWSDPVHLHWTGWVHTTLGGGPVHLWNQLGHPDHRDTDGDKLTEVFRIQFLIFNTLNGPT